jgi:hypothetical protein
LAGIETIENPLITSLEQDMMGSFGNFPEEIYLISVGDGKHAANNATLPDGSKVNGLACFPTPDDATAYMGLLAGLSGSLQKTDFPQAREIAKSKPILDCLFLFMDGRIVEIHFVK